MYSHTKPRTLRPLATDGVRGLPCIFRGMSYQRPKKQRRKERLSVLPCFCRVHYFSCLYIWPANKCVQKERQFGMCAGIYILVLLRGTMHLVASVVSYV